MSVLEFVEWILTHVGGLAGFVALGAFLWNARAARTARRTEFLRRQLQELYGPLFILVSGNDALIKLSQKVMEAYRKEYEERDWSQSKGGVPKAIQEEASQTVRLANQYIHEVQLNNERILDVLENNYYLIDLPDHEVFRDFIIDRARMKMETPDDGPPEVPFRIYGHLGDIWYMRLEFFRTVTARFKEKRAELDKLIP